MSLTIFVAIKEGIVSFWQDKQANIPGHCPVGELWPGSAPELSVSPLMLSVSPTQNTEGSASRCLAGK